MKHRQKRPADKRTYTFTFDRALEELWRPGAEYGLAEYVRPTVPNGFEYECTNAGQSDQSEPDWPVAIAGTIDDGSVEWTARDFDTNASDTINTYVVTVPAGLTNDADVLLGTATGITVKLSGGTLGQSYDVEVEATTVAGEVVTETVRLTIIE